MTTIAVFCSSGNYLDREYYEMSFSIGKMLGKSGVAVMYGGSNQGMMESLAEGVKSECGILIGVVPEYFQKHKISSLLDELIIVKNVSERKQYMLNNADKFLVLQGGIGTLDEFYTVLAAKQIGEYLKDVFVYNYNGFFNPIIEQISMLKKFYFINNKSDLFKQIPAIEKLKKNLFKD